MGYSIALVLARHGLNVVTCLQGRSQLTRQRAELAGITNLPGLPDVAAASDLIISVVVPSAALEVSQSVAKAIAATRHEVLFADANAISPMTSIAIGEIITTAGGKYVDVSIIGAARNLEKGATFYVAGEHASEFAALQNFGLQVHLLGDHVGQASAFKMVYAGLTKGMSSLAVELLLTSRALGILDQILEKYQSSYPEIMQFIADILPGLPPRAARRSQEMDELAATIERSGLNSVMATASGTMLKRIGNLNLRSTYTEQNERQRSLQETIEILYQKMVKPAR